MRKPGGLEPHQYVVGDYHLQIVLKGSNVFNAEAERDILLLGQPSYRERHAWSERVLGS
jgi:hypothetical protein